MEWRLEQCKEFSQHCNGHLAWSGKPQQPIRAIDERKVHLYAPLDNKLRLIELRMVSHLRIDGFADTVHVRVGTIIR